MKRLLILLFSIMLPGSVFSVNNVSTSNHFYYGGGIATLVASDTLRLKNSGKSVFQTSHDSGNSYGAQIFFGYHRMLDTQRFIAAEAALRGMIGRSSGEKLNYVINTPRVSMPFSLSLSLKPGVTFLDSNLFYLMVGGILSKISMFQSYNSASMTMSVWRPGVLLGLGTEMAIGNQYSLNLNYDYEWYQVVNKFFPANNFNDRLQPRDQVISLNLVKAIT